MFSPRKASIIGQSTFKEVIRDKIMYLFILASIFLIILSYITSKFSYGHPSRIALHFGLTAISLCSIAISIFIGVSLLTREIERRTIHTIISKPVSRETFLIGKISGLLSIILLNIFFLYIVLRLLMTFFVFEHDLLLIKCILLEFTTAILILSCTVFFTTFSSKTLSVIFSFSLYFAGNSTQILASYAERLKQKPVEQFLVKAARSLLPDFARLNIRNSVFYNDPVTWTEILNQFTYGISYATVVILLAILIFKRRNFI